MRRRGWDLFQRCGHARPSSDHPAPDNRPPSARQGPYRRGKPISGPLPLVCVGAQMLHSYHWNNTFYSLRFVVVSKISHSYFALTSLYHFVKKGSINRKSTVMENPSQCFLCLNFYQSSSSEGIRSVRNRRTARWKSPCNRIFSRSVIRTGSSFISLRIHSSTMPTSAYL